MNIKAVEISGSQSAVVLFDDYKKMEIKTEDDVMHDLELPDGFSVDSSNRIIDGSGIAWELFVSRESGIGVKSGISIRCGDKTKPLPNSDRVVGRWWNDRDIDLVEIDGDLYALNEWNGEAWTACWRCSNWSTPDGEDRHYIWPVYRWEKEGIDPDTLDEESDGWDWWHDIVDYKIGY